MIIGVNIEKLYPGKIGGAEQYVRNVINELAKIEDVVLILFVNEFSKETFNSSSKYMVVEVRKNLDIETQLRYFIDLYNVDIMFCPLFYAAPKDCSIPIVVSILDIQQDYFPEYFSKEVLKQRKLMTKETVRISDAIVTISKYSKKTIIDKYNVKSDRICVTYLNSDSCFDNELDDGKLHEIRNKIGFDYIFYPANSWPHKNHINLLKAYQNLKQKGLTNLKLVFTGDGKQQKDNIDDFIKDNNLINDVIYMGYVSQEEMPYYFANAKILVFPSLFEGFGIPLVEAMRVGVPIACSNLTSIPEIVGEAGLYFDPTNIRDISDKLFLLEHNDTLRNDLIKLGLIQSAKFSWAECAQQTYDFFRNILASSNKSKKHNIYSSLPLVSIITPSYNQGDYIRDTIESVLNQNYPNIEYIIIDGGSTDNTIEILKEYGDKIKWLSEKDDGQADAVNKGIKLAKGSIIGWLNSDDTYLDGTVDKIVDYLKNHPKVDMVYGEGYYINKNGDIIEPYATEMFDRDRLAEICFICQPTAFFTKEIVEQVGMLNKKLQLCMDYELWVRMSKIGTISYISEFLATSRMYAENKTLSRRDEVYKEICKMIKKHYKYVPQTWIYGYTDYLLKNQSKTKFKTVLIFLELKYNVTNVKYFSNKVKNHLLHKKKMQELYTKQYADGWLSKIYTKNIELYNSCNVIEIHGIHMWPYDDELIISIYNNHSKIGEIEIKEKGEFCNKIILKKPLKAGQSLLHIKMNRTFCPKLLKVNDDTRCLSFLLKKIEFLEVRT